MGSKPRDVYPGPRRRGDVRDPEIPPDGTDDVAHRVGAHRQPVPETLFAGTQFVGEVAQRVHHHLLVGQHVGQRTALVPGTCRGGSNGNTGRGAELALGGRLFTVLPRIMIGGPACRERSPDPAATRQLGRIPDMNQIGIDLVGYCPGFLGKPSSARAICDRNWEQQCRPGAVDSAPRSVGSRCAAGWLAADASQCARCYLGTPIPGRGLRGRADAVGRAWTRTPPPECGAPFRVWRAAARRSS